MELEVSDRRLDGPHGSLPVRVYRPLLADDRPAAHGLVWLHGGGFSAGTLDWPEADWVSRAFAQHGIAVVSVDYRLAPLRRGQVPESWFDERVHYPVASHEVAFAFEWAAMSGLVADRGLAHWAFGGASAGANLAAGAVLRLAHERRASPALAVLAYPTLLAVQPAPDPALRAALDASPERDRFAPAEVLAMYENYLGGPIQDADIYAIPGLASAAELAVFPPTIIINDEVDELRVSGEAFAAKLREAGVDVDASTEPGTRHGHLNRPDEPAAQASVDRFAARIGAV